MHSGVIYRSPRRFEVVGWGVGHHGLLLRSHPAPGRGGRVEIWFKPAAAACLATELAGLEITVGRPETARPVVGETRPGETVYEVRSGRRPGWVLAGSTHGREGDENASLPLFDGWGLRPGVRELFRHVGGGQ
ncbi:hypothetical protein [Cryptosporangium japonicum]|uniref:hypothetical protein n=1 Tax=Cryptosporangium japonicum TaxID=80872 RepID=UPI0031E37EB5